jgi:hypothetical protein
MATVAIPIITIKGVYAILGVCSDEVYKAYLEEGHKIFEYSISAKYFKDYLRKHEVNFIEVEESKLGLVEIPPQVLIWKEAIIVSIEDVKSVLKLFKLDYNSFIGAYTEHLKSL